MHFKLEADTPSHSLLAEGAIAQSLWPPSICCFLGGSTTRKVSKQNCPLSTGLGQVDITRGLLYRTGCKETCSTAQNLELRRIRIGLLIIISTVRAKPWLPAGAVQTWNAGGRSVVRLCPRETDIATQY